MTAQKPQNRVFNPIKQKSPKNITQNMKKALSSNIPLMLPEMLFLTRKCKNLYEDRTNHVIGRCFNLLSEFFFYQVFCLFKCLIKFRGIFAAGLGHLGTTSPAAVNYRGYFFNNVTGFEPLFNNVISHSGYQCSFIVFTETKYNSRRFFLLSKHIYRAANLLNVGLR